MMVKDPAGRYTAGQALQVSRGSGSCHRSFCLMLHVAAFCGCVRRMPNCVRRGARSPTKLQYIYRTTAVVRWYIDIISVVCCGCLFVLICRIPHLQQFPSPPFDLAGLEGGGFGTCRDACRQEKRDGEETEYSTRTTFWRFGTCGEPAVRLLLSIRSQRNTLVARR